MGYSVSFKNKVIASNLYSEIQNITKKIKRLKLAVVISGVLNLLLIVFLGSTLYKNLIFMLAMLLLTFGVIVFIFSVIRLGCIYKPDKAILDELKDCACLSSNYKALSYETIAESNTDYIYYVLRDVKGGAYAVHITDVTVYPALGVLKGFDYESDTEYLLPINKKSVRKPNIAISDKDYILKDANRI